MSALGPWRGVRAGRLDIAAHFTSPRSHRHVPKAGHDIPQEAPALFAAAVMERVAM